jgi:hypothetical protein
MRDRWRHDVGEILIWQFRDYPFSISFVSPAKCLSRKRFFSGSFTCRMRSTDRFLVVGMER